MVVRPTLRYFDGAWSLFIIKDGGMLYLSTTLTILSRYCRPASRFAPGTSTFPVVATRCTNPIRQSRLLPHVVMTRTFFSYWSSLCASNTCAVIDQKLLYLFIDFDTKHHWSSLLHTYNPFLYRPVQFLCRLNLIISMLASIFSYQKAVSAVNLHCGFAFFFDSCWHNARFSSSPKPSMKMKP